MATGKTAAIAKSALERQKATCANRLIPRLTRYLFNTDKNAAKQRVRQILRSYGYTGPGWNDEARAIAVCESAGHDMSKFERKTDVDAWKVPDRLLTPVEVVKPSDSSAEKLKNVTIILMQAEKEIVRQFKDGRLKSLSGLAVTVGAALEEIRR